MEIGIRKYSDSDYNSFKEMLGVCFPQDYNIQLTESQLERLCKDITQSVEAGITFLDFLILDGNAIGFISYQIDSLKSDWCEKEGYGCIREMFVSADQRGKGYGRSLAIHAENELQKLSVPYVYLTTDDNKDFWTKIGYRDTGEICIKNDGSIFIK